MKCHAWLILEAYYCWYNKPILLLIDNTRDTTLTSSFLLLHHTHGPVLLSTETQSHWDVRVSMPPTLLHQCSVRRGQGSYADFRQRWRGLEAEWWGESADREGQGWRWKHRRSRSLPWLAPPDGTRQVSGRIFLLPYGPQCPPGQTEKHPHWQLWQNILELKQFSVYFLPTDRRWLK